MQVGHACLEAGNRFEQPPDGQGYLIVLAVSSEDALLSAVDRMDRLGIGSALFFEPDGGLGYTAACTEPVSSDKISVFKKYSAWQA